MATQKWINYTQRHKCQIESIWAYLSFVLLIICPIEWGKYHLGFPENENFRKKCENFLPYVVNFLTYLASFAKWIRLKKVKTIPRKPNLELTINCAKNVWNSLLCFINFFSQNFRILFSEIFAFIFMRNFLFFSRNFAFLIWWLFRIFSRNRFKRNSAKKKAKIVLTSPNPK